MRQKQKNTAAALLAGMVLLLTMFPVSAQSNTIAPTLKKVGYGIKDSSGTVNVYEQAFLIKSGTVNVLVSYTHLRRTRRSKGRSKAE